MFTREGRNAVFLSFFPLSMILDFFMLRPSFGCAKIKVQTSTHLDTKIQPP